MQILSANHWIEVGDQYRRVRGRTEGAGGDCSPIGRRTISTNPDPSDLLETMPNTKAYMGWFLARGTFAEALYGLSGRECA